MTVSNNSISLCICTYNRCDELQKTLDSLVHIAPSLFEGDELIVVDNNSSDQTAQIVERYCTQLPVKYLFEKTQGLSAARNCGIKRFKNAVIVFIDDDITVTNGFLQAYRQAFVDYPKHAFFGGKILLDWQGEKPAWLKADNLTLINGLIGHYSYKGENGDYDRNSLLPYGANFAVRRELVNAIGEFDPTLGVCGTQIGRGEETDYFQRALLAGFKGRYVADARVRHRFQAHRISTAYLYRYGIEKGRAEFSLTDRARQDWFFDCLLFLLRALFQLLKGRRDRFYQCIINLGIIRGLYLATINSGQGSDKTNLTI